MGVERTIRILGSTRSEPTRCKSCGASITFALTYPNRKRIPLNGRPIARSAVENLKRNDASKKWFHNDCRNEYRRRKAAEKTQAMESSRVD